MIRHAWLTIYLRQYPIIFSVEKIRLLIWSPVITFLFYLTFPQLGFNREFWRPFFYNPKNCLVFIGIILHKRTKRPVQRDIHMHIRYLTKSRFQLTMDCPTKLYYEGKPEYINHDLEDSFLSALAEGGFQVGARHTRVALGTSSTAFQSEDADFRRVVEYPVGTRICQRTQSEEAGWMVIVHLEFARPFYHHGGEYPTSHCSYFW